MNFHLVDEKALPELQARLLTFQHPSGMRHVHVACEDPQSAFALAFPTPPDADDGRAHILEHLVLMGSEKFPVAGMFHKMTKRSLASFMNAMTFSDRTVYPFATPDAQDFENLMDVYLDATFFPLLRREDFQQEGWRYALRDPQGPLEIEGVVFNEMKGSLASRNRVLYRHMLSALAPGSAYAFESGGDPASIPSLSYEALVAFHQQHYHPSQSVALSYGAFDPKLVQDRLEDVIDRRSDAAPASLEAPMASTLQAPVELTLEVPSEGPEEQTRTWGWVLGRPFEGDNGLVADVMSQALMASDAAILTQRISKTGPGRLSGMVGPLMGQHEILFMAGIDGLSAEDVEAADALILSTLEEVARNGLPVERLKAAFHEVELQMREPSEQMPQGAKLLVGMAPAVLEGVDPTGLVDVRRLEALEAKLTDPRFIAQWVQENLIDNPRRVRATFVPVADWQPRRAAAETTRLGETLAAWSDEERQAAIEATAAFDARGEVASDPSCLPTINLGSSAREPHPLLPHRYLAGSAGKASALFVEAPNQGVGEAGVLFDLTQLDEGDQPWVKLMVSLLPHMGVADLTWEEAAQWRSERAQGLSSDVSLLPVENGLDAWVKHAHFSAQAIERLAGHAPELLARSILYARFDDIDRLRFLVRESTNQVKSAANQLAPRWALQEVACHLSPLSAMRREMTGRPAVAFLEDVLALLEQDPNWVVDRLTAAHHLMLAQPRLVVANGGETMAVLADRLAERMGGGQLWPAFGQGRSFNPIHPGGSVALTGKTPVQFCMQAWAVPAATHPDNPVLDVLGQALDQRFLHPAIREKGSAYGSFVQNNGGLFVMGSHRDPRLMDTFEDFSRTAAAVVDTVWSDEELREAKLGLLQRVMAPQTPAVRALTARTMLLTGVTEDARRAYRENLLDATSEDLQRVAAAWLDPASALRAVFTSPERAVEAEGFEAMPVLPEGKPASQAKPRQSR